MNLATTELTDFLLLPEAVRTDVESWHSRFQTLTPPIQRALAGIASAMGASAGTARRKYDAWRKDGWRGLVNRTKVRDAGSSLSPEFIEWWKRLCEQNGRKCKPAYREFVRRFKGREPIHGIEPNVPRGSIPFGYSYDNLMRHKPTRLELTVARVGIMAAAEFRPKVLTSRIGLHVGQCILFDDMWHDFKVMAIGQRSPMRLLQLHAHDLFSGCQFARGLKARMEDPETGKSINLHDDEMLFLTVHCLTEYGFYRDGCVLMAENGTAKIPEWLEKMLFDLTGGKITVDRAGMEGAIAITGYPGRAKGNYRFKAALESLGNLIHNETAGLLSFPGQTGSNSRINCPEELDGREKAFDPLALALMALPEAISTQLRGEFLEVNAAKLAVGEVMERINCRTDHELEGWLQSGLTAIDFEVPSIGTISSSSYLKSSPERQAHIRALGNPIARKMSPREVFDLGKSNLAKLRPEQGAWLLKGKQGREVSVDNDRLIRYRDNTISPDPIPYLADHFAPGDKFTAIINPWSTERLHLFDAKGRWIGQIDRWQTPAHDDVEAIHRQMGAAAKVQKELLAPMVKRGAELLKQRLENAEHNIAVLKGRVADQAAATAEAQDSLMQSML